MTRATDEGRIAGDAAHADAAAGPERAPAPPCLYLLADHLDAVLAAGEDMLKVAVAPRLSGEIEGGAATIRAEVRAAVERIRALELRMLARALKARERAAELARVDDRFALPSRLFVGGTGALVDAVAECVDTSVADFQTGDVLPAYLRSRGLIGSRQCQLADDQPLTVGEDFLVASRIPLGVLLDLVATFLDALELHVDLYAVHDEAAVAAA